MSNIRENLSHPSAISRYSAYVFSTSKSQLDVIHVDRNLLLRRLSSWRGVSGTVLSVLLRFRSYLSSRSFSVKVLTHCSQSHPVSGHPPGHSPQTFPPG